MPVTATHLTHDKSESGAASYNTASITPTANSLVLLTVFTQENNAPSSISGNGLTWVLVDSAGWSDEWLFMWTYRAMGASPSAGAVTINFSPSLSYYCAWAIDEFANVDTSGSNGSGAIVQSVDATNAGGGGSLSITLAAFGSTNNATYGTFQGGGASQHLVEGSGFSALCPEFESSVTYTKHAITEFRNDNDTTVDVTGAWRIIGVAAEIKYSAGATQSIVPILNSYRQRRN